jgi:hypothetical protein
LEDRLKASVTAPLLALLNGGLFHMADLFAFILLDSTHLYYTTFDLPIAYNGNTYLCGGANLKRSKLSFKNDLSVNTLDFTINGQLSGFIEGVPILQAIKNGILDGATMVLSRAFFAPVNQPIMGIGTQVQTLTTDSGVTLTPDAGGVLTVGGSLDSWNVVNLMAGRIADIPSLDRTQAQITCNSWQEILDTQVPCQLFGASCIHNLYDGPDANGNGCKVNIASYTNPTIITGTPTTSMIPTQMNIADQLCTYGMASFTSGLNSGLWRTITNWAANTIYLDEPLPTASLPGDTVTIYYGCDKTMTTCANRFSNLVNYLGFPFIPPVEAAI